MDYCRELLNQNFCARSFFFVTRILRGDEPIPEQVIRANPYSILSLRFGRTMQAECESERLRPSTSNMFS